MLKSTPKKGDKLYVESPYSHVPNRFVEVTKVCSRYFYTSDGLKWDKKTCTHVTKYLSCILWSSEEAYRNQLKLKRTWERVKEGFQKKYSNPGFTQEELDVIAARLEMLEVIEPELKG